MKNESADLARRVGEVLLAEWDPICIRDVPVAADEYQEYVPELVKLLIDGTSIDDLTNHLLHIERNVMGLSGDGARARRVAEKLIAINGR